MPYTKSQDLRDRVIALQDEGHATSSVARWLGVSASCVRRLMQVRRDSDRRAALPRGGWRYQKVDTDRLAELAAEQPDATAAELHARLRCDCSVSAVDEALRRLGLTYEKRRSTPRSRTGPTSPSAGGNGSSRPRTATRAG